MIVDCRLCRSLVSPVLFSIHRHHSHKHTEITLYKELSEFQVPTHTSSAHGCTEPVTWQKINITAGCCHTSLYLILKSLGFLELWGRKPVPVWQKYRNL